MLKRAIPIAAAFVLLFSAAMAVAVAKPGNGGGHGGHGGHGSGGNKGAQTKMTFKLDDHEVDSGSNVTGTVNLTTGKGKKSSTALAGATLDVEVDGEDYATLTTDASGNATVTITAPADGEHQVKVFYAGDATHRSAQRAQGFSVGVATESPSPAPVVTP